MKKFAGIPSFIGFVLGGTVIFISWFASRVLKGYKVIASILIDKVGGRKQTKNFRSSLYSYSDYSQFKYVRSSYSGDA